MDKHIGLEVDEMITVFNSMYAEVWERLKAKVDWSAANVSQKLTTGGEIDLTDFTLQVLEVVMTAARDSTILTLHENNTRIVEQLKAAGVLPRA